MVLQVYRCQLRDGTEVKVDNPSELPDDSERDHILEPYVRCGCCALSADRCHVACIMHQGPPEGRRVFHRHTRCLSAACE